MDLKNKKIVVTGGAGFLGKHVVRNLIEKRGVPQENIIIPRSADCDLTVKEHAERAVAGCHVVIHSAALTGGVGFHKAHPGEVFYKNALMSLYLMEAARLHNVEKFVSIGTVTEYPKNAPVPLREDDLWSGFPEESQFAYSMVKNMLLVQGQAYRQQYGLRAIHLLMAGMYGPGDNWQGSNAIPSLIRTINKAKAEQVPYIEGWGTGKATRDFLYIEDAAEGVVLAAECYDKPDPVNLGSGVETPMKDVLQLVSKFLGYQGEIRWDPTKPEGQLRKVVDISRAKKEFGFSPSVDFAAGLEKTIAAAEQSIKLSS